MIIEPDAIAKFKQWGYYSATLTSKNGAKIGATPTKVISLNTNFCVWANFEAYSQFVDPGDSMQWLENELRELELQNGQAIIIGHAPNQDMCSRQVGKRWHALLDRYQHIVRFGFCGHYHIQGWNVERDMTELKPIGMNFMVGAVTPWGGKHQPSFQVLYLDPDTLIPLN